MLDKNNATQTIQLTGITAGGGESQPLRVTASTNNAQWIQNLALPYTSPASSATLTFTTNGVTDSGQITITITDGGLDNDLNTAGDNLSISHVISVVAKNDPPSVALASQVTSLAENLSMVTRRKVADIVVTDDGIGGQTLTLSGADSRHFEIADNQLFLSPGVILDYESKQQYVVVVEVDDPTVGTTPDGTSTLTLNLTDVNEPPSVALTSVTASLTENTSIATRLKVADIIVTDDALGTNTLTLAGVHASAFEVFQGGLYLRGGTVLDYETLAQWVVIVQVDDSTIVGTPDGTATLTLNVTDVNEAPTVALQDVTTSLPESSSTSNRRKVADVVVTDDALGRPTLTLSGADAGRFELSGDELFLRAGVVLDFETKPQYVVIVEVDDPTIGTTPEGTATLTLNLTDVNELPSLVLTNVTASLPENTNTSTRVKVADVVVTDDALGTNTLTLAGVHASAFEVFQGGLYLRADTMLDYETLAQWVVIVQVDDLTIVGTPDGTATLTLNVTDVNEAPTVTMQNVTTSLPENSSTSNRRKVADVAVTDDALGRPTLTLSGADAGRFELSGNELFLRAGVVLDFETKPQYLVVVEVDDPTVGTTLEGTATLTLNLTDVNEPPSVALTNAVASLPEDTNTSARVKVADIVVTDDALGINSLTLAGVHASAFEVFQGGLYLRAGTVLDFETLAQWVVIVQVDDSTIVGTPDGTATLTLNISDVNEAPTVALQDVTTSLPENSSTSNRRKVADVVVTDDALGRPTLTLSGADASRFELSGNELFLRAGVVLDFETKPQYVVVVEVDDPTVGTTLDGTATLTLNLTDVNEPPSVALTNVTASLPENTNTTARVKVADVVVTDDALGTNTLTLAGVNANRFELFAGGLYLLAGTVLDYETLAQWVVIVQVDDSTIVGTPDGTATLTLNISDVNEAPTVALQDVTTSLPENSSTSNRRKVADVVVTDDALGRPTLTLSGADAGRFELSGNELFLRAGVVLDFETKPQYVVIVEVDDPAIGTTLEAAATLTLNLTDVNEPPSVALANVTASLPENTNTTARVKVADVVVTDDALGTNTLTLAGVNANRFELFAGGLYLLAGTVLDYETLAQWVVIVQVDDSTIVGTPDGTATLTLNISDVNEAPTVALQDVTTSLPENSSTSNRRKVADVVVTDDALGRPTLTLSGADAGRFELSGNELFLRASVVLDYETKPQYVVIVEVDDTALGTTPEATATLTLNLTDFNEPPSVALTNVTASLPENTNTSARLKVAEIVVADDALGDEALRLEGSDADDFEIVGQELFLRAGTLLDFELQNRYGVTIVVDDPTLGNATDGTIDFALAVTNVNERPTELLLSNLRISETTDTSSGPAFVGNVIVVDEDRIGNAYAYALVDVQGATDNGRFQFDGKSLQVRQGVVLSAATQATYLVRVQVTDGPHVLEQAFEIQVTDVNQMPTGIALDPATLPENVDTSRAPMLIGTLIAADDTPANHLLFNLTSGSGDDDNARFQVAGPLLLLKQGEVVDFETRKQYRVRVSVFDELNRFEQALTITVTDVNEPPTVTLANASVSLLENSDATTRRKVADVVVTDDALGTNTLKVAGTNANRFELVGNELFLRAGTPLDFETLSQLVVIVAVDDSTIGNTPDSTATLTLSITDVNEPPTLTLANTITSLPENSDTTARRKVADVVVTDDALGTNTLTLAGTHASRFELVGNELFLRAGTPLDFETLSQLVVTVAVDDSMIGNTPDSTATLTLSITDVNEPPTLALANIVTSLPENSDTTARRKVADVVVTDDALGTNTLTLSGADANRFELVGSALFLRAGTPLDFETLSQLVVIVAVDDSTIGNTPDSTATLTLGITDVNEPPTLALANSLTSLSENSDTTTRRKMADVVVTDDALGTNTLTLAGTHASRFELVGNELFLRAGTPLDSETLSQFVAIVAVDDSTVGNTPDSTATLTLSVTDVNEPPTVALANTITSLLENSDTTTRRKLADVVVTDDALGTKHA